MRGRFWREYFAFPKRERNGIILLFAIMMLQCVFHAISELVRDEDTSTIQWQYIYGEEKKTAFVKDEEITPVKFDPNNSSLEVWLRFGLSERQAKSIHKYIAKGGKFRRREDLDKIFGLNDDQRALLKTYAVVSEDTSLHYQKKPINFRRGLAELNSTDSAGLDALKGIGPAFAKRIINYRNRLGGFMSVEQIKEIYGVDSSLAILISSQVKVDTNLVTKIFVNRCSAEEIKKHPYIGPRLAEMIVRYRVQHGNYSRKEDLLNILILKEVNFLKLEPYISLLP